MTVSLAADNSNAAEVFDSLRQMRAQFQQMQRSMAAANALRCCGFGLSGLLGNMSGGTLESLGRQLSALGESLSRLASQLERPVMRPCVTPPCPTTTGGTDVTSDRATAAPGQVIAGTARIWGDPHFIGADGGRFDVQGEAGKVYNLLSDSGFQMNGRFDHYGAAGSGLTVVGQVGITTDGNYVTVNKDGTASVDGIELRDGVTMQLSGGGYATKKGNTITVKSGEWEVKFEAAGSGSSAHLNMDIKTSNAVADGVKPHGLIGQTFDGDGKARNGDAGKGTQGGGAIEDLNGNIVARGNTSAVKLYEVSDIHDFRFANFNRDTRGMEWEQALMSGSAFNSSFGGLAATTLAASAFGSLFGAMAQQMSMMSMMGNQSLYNGFNFNAFSW